MNTLLLGFIGPQEIIVILVLLLLPGIVVLILLIRYFNRRQKVKNEPKQKKAPSSSNQDSIFNEKNIKNYYPVKEGNKITLIQFNEIVDFSTANNFVFLNDIAGKEYLVDSTLSELSSKLPEEFIRIHKSTIVNKNLIVEVKRLENGRYDLVMKCDKERILSCSKNYNDKIKSIIDF